MTLLSSLADVTSICKPLDVRRHIRPPKTFRDVCVSCVEAFMTDSVVCDGKNLDAIRFAYDEFVSAVGILSPESRAVEEELGAIP